MADSEHTNLSTQQTDPTEIDFGRIYAALLRRLWLVGMVFVVVVTGAAIWTFRQTKIYRAEASIVIDLTAPQVLKGVAEVAPLADGNYWSAKEYFETQYRILRSRAVAERVVARLGLDHDYDFLKIDPTLDPSVRAARLKWVDPAKLVMEAITVVPVRESRVVGIAIEDANAERAANLANAVAEEFKEQNVDLKLETTHGASAWLADQLASIKKKLETSEKALYQFKEDHDVLSTSLEARQNISSEKLIAINDTLTKTELRRVQLETRRQGLQELLGQSHAEFKAESFKPVADNPLISEYKREYFRLQNERAEWADRYLPDHPKRIAIDERIAKVRTDIAGAIQTVLDSAESEFREVSTEEKKLRSLLEEAKQEALAVNKLELQHDRLKREKDQNQQVYDLMVKRQKEVDVSGLLRTNNIRLLDAALVPREPARPNRLQNILIACVIGLLLGLGLVVLLELMDNTIKSQVDVEKGLGLPLLGILPSISAGAGFDADAIAARDLYVSHSPNSAVAEYARSIRTSLLFASPDRPFQVLLVASTGPREGKSTTAISIGITMAQSGNRVLIVDGDLRRPRLHRTFGVPAGAGLSTLILGESSVEDAVKNTSVERLFVMPAGPVPPNPAELLQSDRYGEVVKNLRERFDRIIIDSPPLIVTDALLMSARADGLVLVLRAGATPKKAAAQGRRALKDVNAHVYGAILNDVDLASRGGQYYHYYRYGYYPSEYNRPAPPSSGVKEAST